MKTATFILILLLAFTSFGQKKPTKTLTTQPATATKSAATTQITTQPATTADGKIVILSSDGTWVFGQDIPLKVAKVVAEDNGILSFETGLVLQSGDVKPVARTDFHLLDTSLESILTSAGLQPERSSSILSAFALKYVARELEQLRGASVTTFDKLMENVKPHIAASTTTDFTGKGKFAGLKPGTYYLMCITEVSRNVVVWDLKTEVKAGANSLILDQNNAAVAF